jgi:hypothetical protein
MPQRCWQGLHAKLYALLMTGQCYHNSKGTKVWIQIDQVALSLIITFLMRLSISLKKLVIYKRLQIKCIHAQISTINKCLCKSHCTYFFGVCCLYLIPRIHTNHTW